MSSLISKMSLIGVIGASVYATYANTQAQNIKKDFVECVLKQTDLAFNVLKQAPKQMQRFLDCRNVLEEVEQQKCPLSPFSTVYTI